MAKNSNFEQFKGPGKAYAPKPPPRPTKPPVPFPESRGPRGPSAEDDLRSTLQSERKLKQNRPRNQSTDHMQ